jgi:multiple sugar transport system substrate-binding protein
MAAGLLSACGNSDSNSEPAQTGKDASSEKVTKMIWTGWSGEETAFKPIFEDMVSDWNGAHAEAPVTWMGWPWENTLQQVLVRKQTNEPMDVGQSEIGWLKALVDAGAVSDLSEVFEPSWLTENFAESTLKVGQVDGKQYGIPWTMAATSMIYNPTAFEKAGITAPPTTIEEFEQALQKLKDSDKDIIPYGALTKSESMSNDIQVWLWAFGGGVFDADGNVIINNEAGLKTLEWYKKLLDKGFIKMDLARADVRQLYTQNKVGFYDDAILALGLLKTAGVADADLGKHMQPIPRPVLKAGDVPQSKMWGHLLVIYNTATDKNKAADFIRNLVDKETSLNYFKEGGLLPVKKDVIADETIQGNDLAVKWLNITETSRRGDTEMYNQKKELDSIIVEEFQAAMLNAKKPQQALDDAAARIKTTLGK